MAYEFVLRHVNKSVVVEGVYTKRKWEYPVKAIREAIRNAVVHRDYSLAGKDIKIAIYDDMIEITNPGKLLPSIDYSKLYDRQSDVRNKVLAPVFKLLGIIDQWGNGLKLIGDELDKFDNIELVWKESGLQFQVQFVDTRYIKESGIVEKKGSEKSSEKKHGKTRDKVVEIIKEESKISANEISIKLGVSQRAIEKHITNLKKEGILKRIGPDKGGHWEIVINIRGREQRAENGRQRAGMKLTSDFRLLTSDFRLPTSNPHPVPMQSERGKLTVVLSNKKSHPYIEQVNQSHQLNNGKFT